MSPGYVAPHPGVLVIYPIFFKGVGANDYGARASADLIVTRGDGFRKEKNKKKRGSYRGGEITVSTADATPSCTPTDVFSRWVPIVSSSRNEACHSDGIRYFIRI